MLQLGCQPQGVRPNLDRRRAAGVRSLFRVPALQSLATRRAMADMNVELRDADRDRARDIRLVLGLDVIFHHLAPAVGTGRRQERLFRPVDFVRGGARPDAQRGVQAFFGAAFGSPIENGVA
jgi:hypothetical protein